MRTPMVAGNWKMNKTIAEAEELIRNLLPGLEGIKNVENVVCPPAISLAPVSALLEGTSIGLGAQNLYWEESGAFTGELSPGMVKEICSHVIIGHSERRQYFRETNHTVNKRIMAALDVGLIPIVCVGETLEENEADRTEEIVGQQMREGFENININSADQLVVAYEPVWAIGTGKAATPELANRIQKDVVRKSLVELFGSELAEGIRILYGGSVKPDNAKSFFDESDIDGALVGGASLKADSFIAITRAAS
jgi:triosephosphate isomerase